MTRSSPLRRTQLASSPDRPVWASILFDERNTKSSHHDALAAAQAEHVRVREAAIRVYELHELKEVHQRILDQERREQERLKAEAEIAAEDKRLQELKAKTIAKPTLPPTAQEPPKLVTPNSQPSQEVKSAPDTAPAQSGSKPEPPKASPQQNGLFVNPKNPATGSLFASAPQKQAVSQEAAAALPTSTAPQVKPISPLPPPAQARPQTQPPTAKRTVDRYVQIHQQLRTLRKELMAESKVPGSPLKGTIGTFRREIRAAIGQLTGGKGANVQPTSKIMSVLKESLEGRVPSRPVDVSRFVVEPRQPVQGAGNDDATLPSLFIYLLNICAKGIISQFINECGANPKAADPIGVFTAHLFSFKDFQWRGLSLIDILLAKFRVTCPVLFGLRGNDRTERGRLAIGWRKDGPAWITEQSHNDRMAGLGAGFAAVSLRDFSKTSKANPYPPTNYWKALAGIVNSPANETSNTQYVVLRSMIQGHEQRFLDFYGNAAVAALRLALVEFPKKAPQNASAAGSLRALAEVLRTESGLVLA